MLFESESEMKDIAEEALKREFTGNAFEVVPEFDYGLGRTDLVFVNVSGKYWERRIEKLNLSTPIQQKSHLQTFLQLHGRNEITKDYFYEVGALPRREKREALNWLSTHGFVQEHDGKIRTADNLRRHVTTAIGVELKLRKWKRALQQAHRGRGFADYRYVVLDQDHVSAALDNIQLFEEKNVGLISIDPEGNCEKHFTPSRGDPFSALNRWKLNESNLTRRITSVSSD